MGVRGVSPGQEKEEEGYGRERIAEKEAFKPARKKMESENTRITLFHVRTA